MSPRWKPGQRGPIPGGRVCLDEPASPLSWHYYLELMKELLDCIGATADIRKPTFEKRDAPGASGTLVETDRTVSEAIGRSNLYLSTNIMCKRVAGQCPCGIRGNRGELESGIPVVWRSIQAYILTSTTVAFLYRTR